MSEIVFQQGSTEHSFIVSGSGTLPILNQNTDATELFIRGFNSTSDQSFLNYHQLINIVFDENLITLNDGLLLGTKVDTFTIPKNAKNLIANPFDNGIYMKNIFVDHENQFYCDIDGVLYTKDKKTLVFWPGNHGETEVIVPKFVEKLSSGAFSASDTIKFILIPQKVKKIGFQLYKMTAIKKVLVLNKNLSSLEFTISQGLSNSIVQFYPLTECSLCKDRKSYYNNHLLYIIIIIS